VILQGRETVSQFIKNVFEFTWGIFKLVARFPDLFGITDYINAKIVFFAIMIFCGFAGIYISRKTEKMIYAIISGVLSFVSLLVMFVTA